VADLGWRAVLNAEGPGDRNIPAGSAKKKQVQTNKSVNLFARAARTCTAQFFALQAPTV
jgi:hypothetical protein